MTNTLSCSPVRLCEPLRIVRLGPALHYWLMPKNHRPRIALAGLTLAGVSGFLLRRAYRSVREQRRLARSIYDIPDDARLPIEHAFGDTFLDCGCPDQYFCPSGGEVECPRHSGFSRCCDRTTEHIPLKDMDYLRTTVATLWVEHLSASSPGLAGGAEVAGVDTIRLQAEIASYVTSWEGNGEVSDGQRQHRLRRILGDATAVTEELGEGPAAEYFSRLTALAKLMYAAGR